MQHPSPRVWLVTFVTLVFTIGLLAGIVLERTVLHRSGPALRGSGPTVGGPGGPGGRGGPSRGGGPGGQSGRGQGRGGPMFGPPPTQYVEDLSREVQLTDEQRTAIVALLRAQEAHLQQMQEEARQVFIQEQEGLHDRIAAVLTAEQAAAFRTWVTRRIGPRSGAPR
jgi:Spy/CpxP family protein refolding chaperone